MVFLVITAVICKRQNPRSDQIERVLNKTHSILWDCRHTECNPGNGLNVQCGTSVPFNKSIECVQCKPSITYSDTHDYSTCKICRKCKKHEEKIGYCSVEEDTTKCLGTCENDYYWENNTCHPCSDCCGEKNISEYHEKQCENSALPISRQCRKTVCEHPTNPGHQNRSQEGGAKSGFSLEAVYICTPLAVIVIAICSVLAWMRRKFGWKETKAKVKIFFRCIPCSSLSVSFSEEISDVEEATDKIESLNSGKLMYGNRIEYLEQLTYRKKKTSTSPKARSVFRCEVNSHYKPMNPGIGETYLLLLLKWFCQQRLPPRILMAFSMYKIYYGIHFLQ